MLQRLVVVALAVIVLPAALRADDEWPVPRGPSNEPMPYRYDPKAPIPRAFLEDAPACILYSATTSLVEDDGTVETIVHEVTRLNSRKAIERLGECQDIYWNPVWQKLILNEARVIKPSGAIIPIEPRHVHFRDTNTDFSVYDRDKQLAISFPNLETGDVIEVKWSIRGKNPEFFGQFFARNTFGDDRFPTVLDELRVRVGKNKSFKFKTINGQLEPLVQDEGKSLLYVWQAKNRAELPRDENMPSKENLRLQTACTTFENWEAVADWKHKIRAECWKCTPEISEVVKRVCGDLTDPLAKAKALSTWVRKRIRYVSISGSGAGFTPQLPARVLENRYGDCKDQSQLLAVMLREAGLDVELVTLGVLDDGQVIPEIPMPWGTHAILLVTIDGKEHWIDTTIGYGPWDLLPREDRDRVTYVVSDRGIRVMWTPALAPADNRTAITTVINVQGDGTSLCKRTTTYQGSAAAVQRDAWFETAVGERRRLANAELQEAHSKVKFHWLKIDEASLLDWEGPLSAQMKFEIPGHFSGSVEKEASISDSKVWNRLVAFALDHERTTPLDLGTPFEATHEFIVQLPAAFRFDGSPRPRQVRSKWATFEVTVASDPANPRRVTVAFKTRLEKSIVQPEEFPAFRQFHEELSSAWRTWLSFSPTQDAADIPVLMLRLWTDPADSGSAAVLAQLLASQKQDDTARQVLRLAQAFRPDDEELWDWAVKMSATLKDREKVYRDLVKRFPDQPKYAVQLGAVRVKLGDHAGAKKVLQPLTKTGPDTVKVPAHLEMARSLLAQGKSEAALKNVFEARLLDVDAARTVEIALLEGEVLEKLHAPAKAMEAYRIAVKAEPDNASALAALIRLELAAGKREEALSYLRRFTVTVGDDREGLERAASWNLQLGRLDEAEDLARGPRQTASGTSSQRILGLVAAARGHHAKAVMYLAQAAPDAEVLLALIRGHLALGQLPNAIEAAGKSSPYSSGHHDLTNAVSAVRRLGERRQAYLKDLHAPETNRASAIEAFDAYLCAFVAYEQGQPAQQVETLIGLALAKNPDCPPAIALRGLTRLDRGQLSKALVDADRALALNSEEPNGYHVRGRVGLERANPAALGDLVRAARLTNRRDGLILHWLATAQYQAGLREQALATQGEAAMLLPAVAEIREQLQEFRQAIASKAAG
jgi:tetratricopeptide (TPR) repeat protein